MVTQSQSDVEASGALAVVYWRVYVPWHRSKFSGLDRLSRPKATLETVFSSPKGDPGEARSPVSPIQLLSLPWTPSFKCGMVCLARMGSAGSRSTSASRAKATAPSAVARLSAAKVPPLGEDRLLDSADRPREAPARRSRSPGGRRPAPRARGSSRGSRRAGATGSHAQVGHRLPGGAPDRVVGRRVVRRVKFVLSVLDEVRSVRPVNEACRVVAAERDALDGDRAAGEVYPGRRPFPRLPRPRSRASYWSSRRARR